MLPEFPMDTRFFQTKDGHWRATRPMYSRYGGDIGDPGAWFIYPNGTVEVKTSTYIEYCERQCTELTRDVALELFRVAIDERLPEGF